MSVRVGAHIVRGAVIDDWTRCAHHCTPLDVVALRLRCCGDWYPCARCHDEAVDHLRELWEPEAAQTHAALCGVCATTLSIAQYRSTTTCPACGAAFNPACVRHHALYFR